ncbi:ATP-dependent DNA helicase [Trichonephila clavipes]|nr:ATP-dependent DNA helicase [Trichonephila clavipes]
MENAPRDILEHSYPIRSQELVRSQVQQIALNPLPTTLTGFFTLRQNDAFAKTLLYSEVPTYYMWNASRKLFERRKRGQQVIGQPGIFKEKTIIRLYTAHPNQDECFFLRMLLVNVPDVSFKQLRTVNGVTHSTFRSACHTLNLLENDLHWDVCINDVCNMSHPKQIRALFAIVLTACSPSSTNLWEKYKSRMAEDIFHRMFRENSNMHLDFTAEHYNEALIMIEDLCLEIANKVLNQLGMPSPTRSAAASFDAELRREQNNNMMDLSYVSANIPKLTLEQKGIYDQIMQTINSGNGKIFFLEELVKHS